MTREQYQAGIRKYFRVARIQFVAQVMGMSPEEFEHLALGRWDQAISQYGHQKDLSRADLVGEAGQEGVDGPAYWVMEFIKQDLDEQKAIEQLAEP